MAVDTDGNLYAVAERCVSGLTLKEAGEAVAALCRGRTVQFAVASPDLWNRRQDSGRSGFEIMQAVTGMPPMLPADNRRVPGWRMLKQYLAAKDGSPYVRISRNCPELIRCLPALLFDSSKSEDASSEPHSVTHSPEALRYAVMSRCSPPVEREAPSFFILPRKKVSFFD